METSTLSRTTSIPAVVGIREDLCVNCHSCIAVCPVKECNDGSGDTVKIIADRCIGCGRCIEACTHNARYAIDDTDLFMNDLASGTKMIAIVAPSATASYGGQIERFNGFLKNQGIAAVYDVSFGAELTVKSYLEIVRNKQQDLLIAQPCPAIVQYIEMYRPQLIPYLAQAHSPMLHTIIMIREFFPEWDDYAIAVLSPCLAKKREFMETGLGDYNVTLLGLSEKIPDLEERIRKSEPVSFDGPSAERAVAFSSPGGLAETVLREKPELRRMIKRIEGSSIFPYLDSLMQSINQGKAPLLIDCLNCELGCNGGSGTGKSEVPADILEAPVSTLREKNITRLSGRRRYHRLCRSINRYWRKDLYRREYTDSCTYDHISSMNENDLEDIFIEMGKEKPSDHLNCGACGYGSCLGMARAIKAGLNKVENCHFYLQKEVKKNFMAGADEMARRLGDTAENVGSIMEKLQELIESFFVHSIQQEQSIDAIYERIVNVVKKADVVSHIASEKKHTMENTNSSVSETEERIENLLQAITVLGEAIKHIKDISVILDDIAQKTNLLAINASIEAAHAGTSGSGFSIIAQEIRKFAGESKDQARMITETIDSMAVEMEKANLTTNDTVSSMNECLVDMKTVLESFDEIYLKVQEVSTDSDRIEESMDSVKSAAVGLNTSFTEIRTLAENMHTIVGSIQHVINKADTLIHTNQSAGDSLRREAVTH